MNEGGVYIWCKYHWSQLANAHSYTGKRNVNKGQEGSGHCTDAQWDSADPSARILVHCGMSV